MTNHIKFSSLPSNLFLPNHTQALGKYTVTSLPLVFTEDGDDGGDDDDDDDDDDDGDDDGKASPRHQTLFFGFKQGLFSIW